MAVYFLSTGRTGTKSIANICSQVFPGIRVSHERSGTRILNITANMEAAQLISSRLVRRLWQRAFSDNATFIEANNFLWRAANVSEVLSQRDLVVHVLRDPRAYVVSHSNIVKQRAKSFIANSLTPFWQPGLKTRSSFGASDYEKFANIWSIKNQFISDAYSVSCQYSAVKFEDLFSEDEEVSQATWLPLIAMIEGATEEEAIIDHIKITKDNVSTSHQSQLWRNWTREDAILVENICGDYSRQYGYLDEPEWFELIT